MNDILIPQPRSNLAMLMWIPTGLSKWIRYWLIGRSKKRIIMVITAMINGHIYSFVDSVDGMLGK